MEVVLGVKDGNVVFFESCRIFSFIFSDSNLKGL